MSAGDRGQDWLVEDLRTRFWRRVGKTASPPTSTEGRGRQSGVADDVLATVVGELCFVEQVVLGWMATGESGLRGFEGGVRIAQLGGRPQPLAGAAGLGPALSGHRLGITTPPFAHEAWCADGVVHLHAVMATDTGTAELLLSVAGPRTVAGAPDPERLAALLVQLQRPRALLYDLVASVRSLRRQEAMSRALARRGALEQLEREVVDLVLFERDGTEPKLARACELLDDLHRHLRDPGLGGPELDRVMRLVERVLRVVIHRVLGARSTVRDHAGASAARESRENGLITRIAHRIETLLTERHSAHPVGRAPAEAGLSVDGRLRLLHHVLQSACEPQRGLPDDLLPGRGPVPEAAPPAVLRAWELRLFALWALAHDQLARTAAPGGGREPGEPAADQTWTQAVAATRAWLPRILARWSAQPDDPARSRDPFDATRVRNWFRLWFALDLLDDQGMDAGIATERWRTRSSLAFVLRECLRFKLYGARPGFVVRPDAFSAALQDLVDHHVRRRVRLPREHDVRGHLAMVGDAAHPRGYLFAAGHLQHVIELYIVGHFLCEVKLENVDQHGDAVMGAAPRTMADLLAGKAGIGASARARDELRAAFSLAALFHDVGMTLFPDLRAPRDPLTGDDPSLAEGLREVQAALAGAGRGLVRRAARELENHGIWDAVEEPGLAEWIAGQEERGRPDHALVGAWYLLRAARAVEELSPEVLRAAVRAVLLHGAVPQAIDPERDPVAALLVLCDELFDWEPGGRSGPDPATLGRSLNALAVDMSPRRSRASHLRFHGTTVRVVDGAHGPVLEAAIDVGAAGPRGWPHIELQLVDPEFLGAHVFPVWLRMGQNLGRIQRGVLGWGPVITVVGAIPDDVRRTTGSTARLLARLGERVRLRDAGRLGRWLEERPEVQLAVADGEEAVVIVPLGRALGRRDLRPAMPALVSAAERLMLEIVGRQR